MVVHRGGATGTADRVPLGRPLNERAEVVLDGAEPQAVHRLARPLQDLVVRDGAGNPHVSSGVLGEKRVRSLAPGPKRTQALRAAQHTHVTPPIRMPTTHDEADGGDSHGLDRFVRAQAGDYARALAEIRGGQKRTHWMWYVFPQVAGLGTSATARDYALTGLAEAEAYLRHPVLGPRLLESTEAALRAPGRTAREVFGYPDVMKLRSSATLFACVSPGGSVFHRLLDRHLQGEPDRRTLALLGATWDGRPPDPDPLEGP